MIPERARSRQAYAVPAWLPPSWMSQRIISTSRLKPWPDESMRPAPYETVLVVVEEMPRARGAQNQGGRFATLPARKHLTINGRALEPIRNQPGGAHGVNSRERFRAPLDHGRLRFALSIPAQTALDPMHDTARIKLYKPESD
jgi:hypothetical protein